MSNSSTVTNHSVYLDSNKLTQYIQGKTSLIAQGGGQRGIFTSGVLDAFLISNFDPFDTFYGTSAGALNLSAYLCRQHGLGRSFVLDLTTDSRFFSLFGYIRNQQYLDLDWALDQMKSYPYKLDIDMGKRALGSRKAWAAVTDSEHLSDHYLPMLKDDWSKVLIATCAIPRLYSSTVTINNMQFVDGGVAAAIPVQQAWRDEARVLVVIRTEPAETMNRLNVEEESEEGNNLTIDWLKEPLSEWHLKWNSRLSQWKTDWVAYVHGKLKSAQLENKTLNSLKSLNGGRWLFGAGDIYRLNHLLGDKLDSFLADMVMVHYQTYSLTQQFLSDPPDDCFVIQIAPNEPLKSTSLMSKPDDLIIDYQQGVEAGLRFIETYNSIKKSSASTLNTNVF